MPISKWSIEKNLIISSSYTQHPPMYPLINQFASNVCTKDPLKNQKDFCLEKCRRKFELCRITLIEISFSDFDHYCCYTMMYGGGFLFLQWTRVDRTTYVFMPNWLSCAPIEPRVSSFKLEYEEKSQSMSDRWNVFFVTLSILIT